MSIEIMDSGPVSTDITENFARMLIESKGWTVVISFYRRGNGDMDMQCVFPTQDDKTMQWMGEKIIDALRAIPWNKLAEM